jgi:hypothetical protein
MASFKTIVIYGFFFTSSLAWADFRGCGVYSFTGTASLKGRFFHLVINPHTQSQYDISFSSSEQEKLAPYFQKSVVGKVSIIGRHGYDLIGQQLSELHFTATDYLNPKEFTLIEGRECSQ